MGKIIVLSVAVFFLSFGSADAYCLKYKKYGSYDKCQLECGFKYGSTVKKFRCEENCKNKYKRVLKYRKKFEKCYPLSREDILCELRGKYNINIWQ